MKPFSIHPIPLPIHPIYPIITPGDAAASLSTIFIVRLVTSAVVNVFVRKFLQGKKEDSETGGLEPGVVPTPIEEQYILDEYPVLLGNVYDLSSLMLYRTF